MGPVASDGDETLAAGVLGVATPALLRHHPPIADVGRGRRFAHTIALRNMAAMAVVNPSSRLPALRPVTIFQGLRKATLFEIARRTSEITYPAGAVVVREGDPGDRLCIVVSGVVEVSRDGRTVRQLEAGDYFGEISLIDGRPRSATVTAVDDVVTFELRSEDFESLLNVAHVARVVMTNLASIIRDTRDPQT